MAKAIFRQDSHPPALGWTGWTSATSILSPRPCQANVDKGRKSLVSWDAPACEEKCKPTLGPWHLSWRFSGGLGGTGGRGLLGQ